MARHQGMLRSAALVTAIAALGVAPAAAQARTLNISESASLHLVHKSGSTLFEQGSASGSLPGAVAAQLKVTLVVVTGTVTFYPRGGGSLTMRMTGYPKSAGTVAKFGGSMTVSSGTGRYAQARGSATFSGTVNRRSWAANVSARGRLSY